MMWSSAPTALLEPGSFRVLDKMHSFSEFYVSKQGSIVFLPLKQEASIIRI